jgi:hypothetical protein
MVRSVKLIKILMLEGSEMKTGRLLMLLVLVLGLLAGPWQAPAEAEMLGRPGQIINLYYSYDPQPHWAQIKPDGSISNFTLAPGQSFIMTSIGVRFYVSDTGTQTGPYRFYLLGPNQSRMFIANLSDIKYPGSDTVWGGGLNAFDSNTQPGVAFSVIPTPQVQQIPQPPDSPNSGPVRTGTFYMTVRGYILP